MKDGSAGVQRRHLYPNTALSAHNADPNQLITFVCSNRCACSINSCFIMCLTSRFLKLFVNWKDGRVKATIPSWVCPFKKRGWSSLGLIFRQHTVLRSAIAVSFSAASWPHGWVHDGSGGCIYAWGHAVLAAFFNQFFPHPSILQQGFLHLPVAYFFQTPAGIPISSCSLLLPYSSRDSYIFL